MKVVKLCYSLKKLSLDKLIGVNKISEQIYVCMSSRGPRSSSISPSVKRLDLRDPTSDPLEVLKRAEVQQAVQVLG